MSANGGRAKPALIQRGQWLTMRDCKSVLVIVPTVTYAQRLYDVFSLFRHDFRVQAVFTVAPHPFGAGVTRYLRKLGISVVPWSQAVRQRFDLALAAGSGGIDEVRAPVIRLSHGAGHNKPLRVPDGAATGENRPAGMLSRHHLMRDGRVVPAAVALAHQRDLTELANSCPEALPVATVVGDPCHDRIVAHLPRRARYRRDLGIRKDQRLLLVSSTWGPTSTFGRLETVLPQLLGTLPRRGYRAAVLVHPNVYAGHTEWQVRGWLASCLRRGIAVIPPEVSWEALLIAADAVIGDHGSLTAYATLTGVPILLTHTAGRQVTPGSPAALLATRAPVLSPARSLAEQLRYTGETYRGGQYAEVTEVLTSEPGRFHQRMRTLIYRLLELGEPAYPPPVPPIPSPSPLGSWQQGEWEVPA